jgi:hypothetical protein
MKPLLIACTAGIARRLPEEPPFSGLSMGVHRTRLKITLMFTGYEGG